MFTHIFSSITSSTGSFPASFRVSFLTVILTISEVFELHRLPWEGANRRRRKNVIIGGIMFLTTLTLAIGTAWQCHDKSSKKEIRACLSLVCTNRTVKSAPRSNSPIKVFQVSLEAFWNWARRAFKEEGRQLNESFFRVSNIFKSSPAFPNYIRVSLVLVVMTQTTVVFIDNLGVLLDTC